MNTDTGALYYGDDEIKKAQARGEPVVPVSDNVAGIIKLGLQAKFGALPQADTPTLDELKARIEDLEAERATERRMKSLGLVLPK